MEGKIIDPYVHGFIIGFIFGVFLRGLRHTKSVAGDRNPSGNYDTLAKTRFRERKYQCQTYPNKSDQR